MPMYEYECTGCRRAFEEFKPINKRDSAVCPECGAKASKLFTPAPIIFKGSGFYCTDNKKASSMVGANGNGAQPGEESQTDSKPETKSETKTESKPESKPEKKAAVA